MGCTKNGCVMKMLKAQGSKEILIGMDEGRLRSLEKCFLWEEMVRWRRKIKGKKKVNSVNRGREVDKRWSKKEKGRNKEVGGQNFGPHTKNSAKSWVNQKKERKNLFQSFQVSFKLQIFNSKFSIPHSQCPNFKLKSSVFKKSKPQISWSKSQVLIFKILNLKISNFKV